MWFSFVFSLFVSSPFGLDISALQAVLLCPNVGVIQVKQKGYSYLFQLRGSGVGICLADKMAFCKKEKQDIYCRLMDHRVVIAATGESV